MKLLTIQEQMNACIKHANRNKLPIHRVEIYPNGKANHNVIMTLGDLTDGSPYISVAVLINMKNGSFNNCEESTWDVGRN